MPSANLSVPGRQVDVIDTVGAGDTFQAALITGLAERGIRSRTALNNIGKDNLGNLIGFATEAAAITCGRRGADLPHRADLPAHRSEGAV
jgi:fructokinase